MLTANSLHNFFNHFCIVTTVDFVYNSKCNSTSIQDTTVDLLTALKDSVHSSLQMKNVLYVFYSKKRKSFHKLFCMTTTQLITCSDVGVIRALVLGVHVDPGVEVGTRGNEVLAFTSSCRTF